jgi:hypothetical protein
MIQYDGSGQFIFKFNYVKELEFKLIGITLSHHFSSTKFWLQRVHIMTKIWLTSFGHA